MHFIMFKYNTLNKSKDIKKIKKNYFITTFSDL